MANIGHRARGGGGLLSLYSLCFVHCLVVVVCFTDLDVISGQQHFSLFTGHCSFTAGVIALPGCTSDTSLWPMESSERLESNVEA